jgi:hypothetical protein
LLNGLKCTLTELREAVTDQSFIQAKKAEHSYPFAEKLDRKRNNHHSGEENFDFSAED